MQISLSQTNVLKNIFNQLLEAEDWLLLLLDGDLYEFEKRLHEQVLKLYDKLCEIFIDKVTELSDFAQQQKQLAATLGLKKLVPRYAMLQLRTGTTLRYSSLYAKQAPKDYEGSRHLSHIFWHAQQGSSPMYKSTVCLLSVICPSFDIAKDILRYQGIKANFTRVRRLSLSLSGQAMKSRASTQLSPNETLAGQRVVIGMDGGRTRTKVYGEGVAAKRNQKFETPWREPKMFVISTIDEDGKKIKTNLPIYDATFGDDETFELLASYLKELDIDQAQNVQFLADGAPWIWNRVKVMLESLGVASHKIIETLDYYHAAEHINDMKVYFDQDEEGLIFQQLKDALWKGDIGQMTDLLKKGISDLKIDEFKPFNYFLKNKNRLNYQALKSENRPCESGIIESGIRRIINLRFKSPSTFWYPKNVEQLIYMRAVALSGRWEIMMKNITKPLI